MYIVVLIRVQKYHIISVGSFTYINLSQYTIFDNELRRVSYTNKISNVFCRFKV